MATIKTYTDLEQSRKLAEFLPIESADMCWGMDDYIMLYNDEPYFNPYKNYTAKEYYIPCWSLAALLDILPKKYYPIKDHETNLILGKPKDKWCVLYWDTTGMQDGEQTLENNLIDACYEMILKLHEQKLM